MVASRLTIRVSSATKAKIAHNARLMGQRPSEYVRALLDKDEELTDEEPITCAEFDRHVTRLVRHMRLRKVPAVAETAAPCGCGDCGSNF